MNDFIDRGPDASPDSDRDAAQQPDRIQGTVNDVAEEVVASEAAIALFRRHHNSIDGDETDDIDVPDDDQSPALGEVTDDTPLTADSANGGITGPPEGPPSPPDSPNAPDGGDESKRNKLDQAAVDAAIADLELAEIAYENGEVRTIVRPDGSKEVNVTDGDVSATLYKPADGTHHDAADEYEAMRAGHPNRPDDEDADLYVDMLSAREEHAIARIAYKTARAKWDDCDPTITRDDLYKLGKHMHHATSAATASVDKYAYDIDETLKERWPDGVYVNGVRVADPTEDDTHIPEYPVYGSPSHPSSVVSESDAEQCRASDQWDLRRSADYHNFNRRYEESPHVLAALDSAVTTINDQMTPLRLETVRREDEALADVYGRSQWEQRLLRYIYEETRVNYLNADTAVVS